LLMCGEPGTGRETVARAIHALAREAAGGKFITLDCVSDAPAELERQLFGASGDVAGADKQSAVKVTPESAVARAQRGTLFLRHITEAPARVQARLARLLRDREVVIQREAIELDVKVIASADPNVSEAASDGRLRRDLYDRLSQERIDVPPLRRRREDMPQVVMYLLRNVNSRLGKEHTLSRSALALLAALPWPGNARELTAVLERTASGGPSVLHVDALLAHMAFASQSAAPVDEGLTLRAARARFERDCISAALIKNHGRVGDAARDLGIQRTNLYRKVRQLKVPRSLLSTRG
jgi:two-component system response regulator HydG